MIGIGTVVVMVSRALSQIVIFRVSVNGNTVDKKAGFVKKIEKKWNYVIIKYRKKFPFGVSALLWSYSKSFGALQKVSTEQ